jgi:hypothetical protein
MTKILPPCKAGVNGMNKERPYHAVIPSGTKSKNNRIFAGDLKYGFR